MLQLAKERSGNGLAYHVCGDGPTLLLIHGIGLCAESWHYQITPLAHQFKVVCVDLPGHGSSQRWSSARSARLDDFVAALEQFILADGPINPINPLAVCGHSLGAIIGAHLAAKLPERISAYIGLNTVHNRTAAALQAVQTRARLIEQVGSDLRHDETLARWFGDPVPPELVTQRDLCDFWLSSNELGQYAMAYRAFADFSGFDQTIINSIECPALLCTGSEDPNSTPHMSTQLAGELRNGLVKVIPEAKHMMQLTHADKVTQVIHRFLLT